MCRIIQIQFIVTANHILCVYMISGVNIDIYSVFLAAYHHGMLILKHTPKECVLSHDYKIKFVQLLIIK